MFALNGFTSIRVYRISLNFVDEENAKNETTEIKNEIENKINFWIGRTISAIANKKLGSLVISRPKINTQSSNQSTL